MEDKRVFVDTNILLAATDTDREHHADAKSFLEGSFSGAWRAFACPQIFREYLVVATRPVKNNGLGLSPAEACGNVETFQKLVQTLSEGPSSQEKLAALILRHNLKGKRIHDANLVATMEAHGLRLLKTYNPQDFRPFAQISLLGHSLNQ
ncbi:MAG: PIN domain-containing protein [Puniceicoccaceae bacterium]|nr:MAG: PIN domain-containing protein [Puniceicoccaceae bacterium]